MVARTYALGVVDRNDLFASLPKLVDEPWRVIFDQVDRAVVLLVLVRQPKYTREQSERELAMSNYRYGLITGGRCLLDDFAKSAAHTLYERLEVLASWHCIRPLAWLIWKFREEVSEEFLGLRARMATQHPVRVTLA